MAGINRSKIKTGDYANFGEIYGLDEAAVEKKLDVVFVGLKSVIEQNGVSLSDNMEECVRGVVQDCALTLLLNIDDVAEKTKSGIEKDIQANFRDLTDTLLPQLESSFKILAAQAQKDKKEISDAFKKWQNEWRYYAGRAEDAYTALSVVRGFIADKQIKARDFLKYGRYLLSDGNFTAAIERFEKAMDSDSELTYEAYFYKALACCRIQSVWDNNAGAEIPLIHDMYTADLQRNDDFKQAVMFEKDDNKKAHYIEFADQVNRILQEYERIERANIEGKYDYDCFVCVKQSDMESDSNTEDFVWLTNSGLFDMLENTNNIKTFFADRVLHGDLPVEKGSNDYNAFIMYALQKAKVLLFVCSDEDYAQTPWVKNEYTQFISYHKNAQIVLVGSNPKIKIPGVTNKAEILSQKDDIDRIVKCVKSKIESEKDYVDSECFYCEKCGTKYSSGNHRCIKQLNGKVCDGMLLSAVEYANRRNEITLIKLRDKERELAQEKEEKEKAKAENEKLRNAQPITNEEAAAMLEQAENKLEQANRYVKESTEAWRLLGDEQKKNRALKKNQYWLKWKFVFIVIAALSVAFSVLALVSTFYLPLWWAIERNCRWLRSVIWSILFPCGAAMCMIGGCIIGLDEKNVSVFDENRAIIVVIVCGILTGVSFVCAIVFEILMWCGFDSTVFNIIFAVSCGIMICAPIMGCMICHPRRAFAYITFILCVLNTVSVGIWHERTTNSEQYIHSPNNSSQGLHYYYDLSDESFSVRSIGDCADTDIVIPSSRYGWKVNLIYGDAFNGNNQITSITIPNSITRIGAGAFTGCASLNKITIPSSVEHISGSIFSDCSGLTIYCEAESKPIGWSSDWNSGCPVVWDCKNNSKDKDGYEYAVIGGLRYRLKDEKAAIIGQPSNIVSATISSTVTYNDVSYNVTNIGDSAFKSCGNLTSITFNGTKEQWDSITKGTDWDKDTGDYTVHCTDGDIVKS